MAYSVTYKHAVKVTAKYYKGGSLFDASTLLAIMFSIPKEKTMSDLLKEREFLMMSLEHRH